MKLQTRTQKTLLREEHAIENILYICIYANHHRILRNGLPCHKCENQHFASRHASARRHTCTTRKPRECGNLGGNSYI